MRTRPSRLSFRLQYVALRGFVLALGTLPLAWAVGLSGALWWVVAPHLSRHARADRHLAMMMPELTSGERRTILLQMWRSLGETFAEALLLPRFIAEPHRIALGPGSREAIERTVAEGGVIAVPHLGNWELATIPLAAAGAWHASVYRGITNPFVEAHVLAIRAQLFTGGLFPKGSAAAGRLVRHVRRGGSVAVVADLSDKSGPLVPFFGLPAPSTPFPAFLARQFGRPLFAACLVRVAPQRFRLEVSEIVVSHTDDRDQDIFDATSRVQQVFEAWIRRWPGQWMWAQRRF